MRAATQTDIAILNSGSLRSDCVHPTGPFKMKVSVEFLLNLKVTIIIHEQFHFLQYNHGNFRFLCQYTLRLSQG